MDESPLTVHGSRTRPHYFAGRRDELARLDARLRLYRAGDAGAGDNGIELVTGVPGSGKSALLEEFATRCEVPVVRLSPDDLAHPQSVVLAIADAAGIGRWKARRAAGIGSRVSGLQGGVQISGAVGVNGGAQVDRPRETPGGGLMLSALARSWGGHPPVVVLVDELQTAKSQARAMLHELHGGRHGCPVMLVGAGLQHTPRVLAGLGIIRTETKAMTIHLLSAPDADDAVRMNLDAIGRGVTERAVEAIVQSTHGFPVHIQAYLVAAQQHVPVGAWVGDSETLKPVLEDGAKARAVYYRARLNAMGNDVDTPTRAMAIVAEMLEREGDTLAVVDARPLFAGTPYEGADVVGSAIRHGVLREVDGHVDFGIPSFHDYMRAVLARERRREQSRSQ